MPKNSCAEAMSWLIWGVRPVPGASICAAGAARHAAAGLALAGVAALGVLAAAWPGAHGLRVVLRR